MSSHRGRRVALLGVVVVLLAGAGWVGGWSQPTGGPPAAADADADAAGNATEMRGAFRDVANDTGLEYTYRGRGAMVHGGVYVADVTGNRRPDVLAVGGNRPALFRNEGGSFSRVRNFPVGANAALFLDYDNDGWRDLLLLSPGSAPAFFENENGTFVAHDVGFDATLAYPVGATAGDYDGDGCLDVFVVQYADWDAEAPAGRDGRLAADETDNGNPNVLFDGNCSSFARVGDAGIDGDHWTLATSAVDLTGDGLVDLHAANDFANDVVYRNEGDGTFERIELGDATDRNAMSSEVADVNGDGRPDLFVTNIYFPDAFDDADVPFLGRTRGNNLLVNRGGAFDDRAAEYGVAVGGWGWAATIADFDNDGDRDLFHATTALSLPRAVHKELRERALTSPKRFIVNHPYLRWPVYRERVDGTFERRNASRLGFEITDGRGVSRLDFDGDGDLDLVVSQRSGRLKLYENTMAAGNWLRIDVAGTGTVPATGARVHVTTADGTTVRWVTAGADFLSQEPRVVHVGVGSAERVAAVRVVWPDGTERTLRDVAVNRSIRIAPDGNGSRSR